MNNLTTNIGHIVTGVAIIAAAVVLAIHGTITGGETIALIAGAGGFSMGASAASTPSVPVTITGTTTTAVAPVAVTPPALP